MQQCLAFAAALNPKLLHDHDLVVALARRVTRAGLCLMFHFEVETRASPSNVIAPKRVKRVARTDSESNP